VGLAGVRRARPPASNHLYMKTGSRDRAQAVAYAYRSGLAPGGAGADG